MTAAQLLTELTRMLKAGEISPETPVVRPFCMCDENYGWENVQKVVVIHPDKGPSSLAADATSDAIKLQ
jgi:hypothetical protein